MSLSCRSSVALLWRKWKNIFASRHGIIFTFSVSVWIIHEPPLMWHKQEQHQLCYRHSRWHIWSNQVWWLCTLLYIIQCLIVLTLCRKDDTVCVRDKAFGFLWLIVLTGSSVLSVPELTSKRSHVSVWRCDKALESLSEAVRAESTVLWGKGRGSSSDCVL